MTSEKSSAASRPGGRSARVAAAVFTALEELLLENPGDMPSMASVAQRAKVNPTSLYRRWKDVRLLAGEVAVDRLMRKHPIPDTGALIGDLSAWARSAAQSLSTRENVLLLRILTAAPTESEPQSPLDLPIGRRVGELGAMLERAVGRGEATPSLSDVLEIVLAPIYLHALFLGPIRDETFVDKLVNRLFTHMTPPPGPKTSVTPV